MIRATVSSRSCFCWLFRASLSLAAKNISNLISVMTIWWCLCVESFLCCWKRVFSMISAFSWQNSVSRCPASCYTPRPNLPVTSGTRLISRELCSGHPCYDLLSSQGQNSNPQLHSLAGTSTREAPWHPPGPLPCRFPLPGMSFSFK